VLSGQFQFDSAICRLLQVDVGPAEFTHRDKVPLDHQAAIIGAYAARSQDVLPIYALPTSLKQAADEILFHERLHYWQLLSCPHVQYRFLTFLRRLTLETQRKDGRTRMISTNHQVEASDEAEILAAEQSLNRHFTIRPINNRHVRFENPIDRDTSMPFLMIPDEGNKSLMLPCYGARLRYSDGTENLFAFSGTLLWEAAAYIGEHHKRGLAPERLTTAAAEDRLIYLGVWEFWCRLFDASYTDPEALRVAFLAAVDLSLTRDVLLDTTTVSMDESAEQTSIPYRFGKFAYRLRSCPPLTFRNDELSESVDRWQTYHCEKMGWATPTECAARSAAQLTLTLLSARSRFVADTAENATTISTLTATLRKGRQAESIDIECLRPVWDLIDSTREAAPLRIGQAVLGEMLNACWYRINRPGDFAVAAWVTERIAAEFSLPLVLMGGRYYYSGQADHSNFGLELPYRRVIQELQEDFIGLATLRPLRRGDTRCGFIVDRVDCHYLRSGLGCPAKPMTPEQEGRRIRSGMDDWCHWTKYGVLLDIAPPTVSAHWLSRWQE
jgi:hypothetical protein